MESLKILVTFVHVLVILISASAYLSYRSKKKCNVPQAKGAWPIIGHLHLCNGVEPPQKTLGNMADTYGPIFTIRLGSHAALVVSSWELARECFTVHDKAFSARPAMTTSKLLCYDYARFGLAPYGPYWREMRKIATLELFSNKRLDMLKHIRVNEVNAAINELYGSWLSGHSPGSGILVDMKRWFADLILNIIHKMVAGKSFAASKTEKDDSEVQKIERLMGNFFQLFGVFELGDTLPFLKWLDLNGYKKAMKETAKELDIVAEGWLNEHKERRLRQESKTEQDFMDVLLNIFKYSQVSNFDADTITKATCLNMVSASENTGGEPHMEPCLTSQSSGRVKEGSRRIGAACWQG